MKMINFIIICSFSMIILIENGVYNIVYKGLYFNYENHTLQISKSLNDEISSNFRIKKSTSNNFTSYYYIEHLRTNLNIISYFNGSINVTLKVKEKEEFREWSFIQKDRGKFILQNKNHCYLKIRNLKEITCENISLKEASIFDFYKIYEEADYYRHDFELIEKEPIDVVIKYIDLRDPFLIRKGIHQIKKDYDNEELRYSIRSILKNIPWIRKIFIIMPNEKVRFLKNYNDIKDKIIYVKDKDLLGYESSNSLLKEEEYTNKFIRINYKIIKKKIGEAVSVMKKTKEEQSSAVFKYSLYSTYLFVLRLFNGAQYFPIHTHNAISINLNDLKEIYNLIYESEYRNSTLFSLYRHINSLQFQTLVLSYTFIKYNKKIKNISWKLVQNKYSLYQNYNISLFCINTGSINYSSLSFMKSKIVMEYLFPERTKYEAQFVSLSFLSIKTIKFIEIEFEKFKLRNNLKKKDLEKKKNILFINELSLTIFIVFFSILIDYLLNALNNYYNY